MDAQTPISEQYRTWAMTWARKDGAARELEEMKSPLLAKRCKELGGDLSVAAAEREVKATQFWHDYIMETAQARTSANEARAEMDYLMMRHEEEKRRSG